MTEKSAIMTNDQSSQCIMTEESAIMTQLDDLQRQLLLKEQQISEMFSHYKKIIETKDAIINDIQSSVEESVNDDLILKMNRLLIENNKLKNENMILKNSKYNEKINEKGCVIS